MGNACNGGPIHFLGIRQSGAFQLSGPLDFCGGPDPIVKQDVPLITVTIPGGPPNRGAGTLATEVWCYEAGKLVKID